MENHEKSCQSAVAKDLAYIPLVAFGKLFIHIFLALFKGPAQPGRGDEEYHEQDCPLPSAQTKNDRADKRSCNCTTTVQAVSAIRQVSNKDCKDEAKKDLHLNRRGNKE